MPPLLTDRRREGNIGVFRSRSDPKMATGKRFRQGRILDLIASEKITNQEDLRRRLAQTRVQVTQATLSRDLHELNVVKGPEGYVHPSQAPTGPAPQSSLAHAVREFLLDIRPVQNLLVLRTPPGGAQPLALAVDAAHWKGIAGSIAGDDTILIICTSSRNRAMIQQRLKALAR